MLRLTELPIPLLMATTKRTLIYCTLNWQINDTFFLKRRKQDNKNSGSASIRDEHWVCYINIQVFSLLMEKTALQIQTKSLDTCTHIRVHSHCIQWLQTDLGDRRKNFWSAIVLSV